MKKTTVFLAIPAALLTSCTPKDYKLTGTVEGGLYGEKIFLMDQGTEGFVKLDSATLDMKGAFIFTGVQERPVYRYLTYTDGIGDPLFADFFLENGNISVKLAEDPDKSEISGTSENRAYQKFKNELNILHGRLGNVFDEAGETDREKAVHKMENIEEEMFELVARTIRVNSKNALGVLLLTQYNYVLNYEDLGRLLALIPEDLRNDALNELEEDLKRAALTGVGKKYTDFEMANPEGEPVKLSDYVAKGKIVLVNFWAGWCGPCREEMPQLVKIHKQYKDKNFEIVSVSLDMDEGLWKKAIAQLNMTWPQMSDLNYLNSEGAWHYAINAIPYTVLVDAEGIIIARGVSGAELEQMLSDLLGGA